MKKIQMVTEENGLRFGNMALFADGDGAYELFTIEGDEAPHDCEYIEPSEAIETLRSYQPDLRKWRKFQWN